MTRTVMLSASLLFALATAASAAEGCGPGFWRGPGGHCHPFAVNRACPVGYHLGPEGKRCWPN
jgi:Spy/CpxP family protein refolding chaperone